MHERLPALKAFLNGELTMNSTKAGYLILAGLMLLGVFQHAWYWPQLPERVATHFGIDGKPNDWMSRSASTIVFLALQLGVPVFMLAMTSLAARMPVSMVNIPNREYWLHAERRVATMAHMSLMMTWIAVLTSLFMTVIGHLTFIANKTGDGLNLPLFLSALVIFLIAVFTIAGRSMWHFRMPRQ
jgi:uncharacterized membrane protein